MYMYAACIQVRAAWSECKERERVIQWEDEAEGEREKERERGAPKTGETSNGNRMG